MAITDHVVVSKLSNTIIIFCSRYENAKIIIGAYIKTKTYYSFIRHFTNMRIYNSLAVYCKSYYCMHIFRH